MPQEIQAPEALAQLRRQLGLQVSPQSVLMDVAQLVVVLPTPDAQQYLGGDVSTGGVGQFASIGVFNPVASRVEVQLVSCIVGAAANSRIEVRSHDVPVGAISNRVKRVNDLRPQGGQAAGDADLMVNAANAALFGMPIGQIRVPASGAVDLTNTLKGVRLRPGFGIYLEHASANAELDCQVRWAESLLGG